MMAIDNSIHTKGIIQIRDKSEGKAGWCAPEAIALTGANRHTNNGNKKRNLGIDCSFKFSYKATKMYH